MQGARACRGIGLWHRLLTVGQFGAKIPLPLTAHC